MGLSLDEIDPPLDDIETEKVAVRSWLRSYFELLREQAHPIDANVSALKQPDEA